MIDSRLLLADLERFVTRLEDDLRERSAAEAEMDAYLRGEYAAAREAGRTGAAFEEWREEMLTQGAVAWVLGCVFARFLEDNRLVEPPRLSGPGERLGAAKDQHTAFFERHPAESDRDYLLAVFAALAELPGLGPLYSRRHDPVWRLGISGDAARALLELWQRIDPATGLLVHDFTDPEGDTRFLGNLYQDLSEAARKRYALLQTPEFVEELILDRTLGPAIEEFGYREVRLIDPTSGSGHFLLGGFRRLYELHARGEPGTNPRELAQRALEQVHGVDVNPYAAAIARFRLLLAALRASGIERLADAPAFRVHVAAGDSLLHGPRFDATTGAQLSMMDPRDTVRHVLFTEDREELARILGQRYHAVVGNPPYITVKDRALNDAYRRTYTACHRQYSLAVPFMQRFFELALPGGGGGEAAGYVGMITANSFMKREFGKKLIEEHIPRWDLTHVIDTSGAYIPGHGTPTVILFGRHQSPKSPAVRAVMGIRGEPSTPVDPAQGLVWRAIVEQLDRPGSQSEFVSVTDTVRETFHGHPWSLGGGGAAELRELLDSRVERVLADCVAEIGFGAVTRDDEVYLVSREVALRHRIPDRNIRPLVAGEDIRDWSIHDPVGAIWPYDPETLEVDAPSSLLRYLWPWRRQLSERVAYGHSQIERGLHWAEYSMFFRDRYRTPLSIAFAFVATHNHFVLDRGGKVFKQSAPVIKLPAEATEEDHLALLGLLNSSTACFWMKQVFHDKGSGTDKGKWQDDPAKIAYEFAGTGLARFPVPRTTPDDRIRLIDYARVADRCAQERAQLLDAALSATIESADMLRVRLREAEARDVELLSRLVAVQEELDWFVMSLFGLVDRSRTTPAFQIEHSLLPGVRSFEVIAARQGGDRGTDGQTLSPEIPMQWPSVVRATWEHRVSAIENNSQVGLVEAPDYKRRWFITPKDRAGQVLAFAERAAERIQHWLLDRLEDPRHWPAVELTSCARLADRVRPDAEFLQVAELYRGRPDFDLTALVTELVLAEAVPFLPVLRYKPSGLLKREIWERTWALQRREDAGESVGEIPVPPKYTSADFLSGPWWRLRGKLDVPKERFVLYPHAERDADPTPVIAWAGWSHLEQAQALAGWHIQMKEQEGWTGERLAPLLAGIAELVPWLLQWHDDLDPRYGVGMGTYFRDFVDEEARSLGLPPDRIRAWTPPARATRRRRNANRPTKGERTPS